MLLYRGFATIDINQVGDRLERIEADADGEGDLGISHLDAKGIKLLGEETQVFEGTQNQDVPYES